MATGVDLDAQPPQLQEFVEQRGELQRGVLIAPRMRDDGDAARAADPAHRFGQGGPLHGHVAGPVVAQVLGENGLHVGAVAGFDEIPR
ncbi:hypothetical protein G6F68_019035 [Rhizopus microsporus]|nr:hypothetical protein G6F68_019035 [Rhizopus microsporus]